MRFWLTVLSLAIINLSTPYVFADSIADEEPVDVHSFTRQFVVKIVNRSAHIFQPVIQTSHGTGFIVEIDDSQNKGVVFTNRHVVQAMTYDAQQIRLEFQTDTNVPDAVDGRVTYISPIHDFAVVEFPLDKLRRARKYLKAARLPSKGSAFYHFEKHYREVLGAEVFAIGNPLDSDNISTFGQINGIKVDADEGVYIQTQTPINPGNSGGPLIYLETMEVVGINTAIIANANNVGFAIPIGALLEEYLLWKQDPSIGHMKRIGILTRPTPSAQLDHAGLVPLIESIFPAYFDYFHGTLSVEDATPLSGLQSGDEIVLINGAPIGNGSYRLLSEIQRAKSELAMTIIRGRSVLDVKVPVQDLHIDSLRISTDFVFFSGMIFSEQSLNQQWRSVAGTDSRVFLSNALDSADVTFGDDIVPSPFSILTGISIGADYRAIRSLLDLKKALRTHPDATSARLHMRKTIESPDGMGILHANGFPLYSPTVRTFIVPIKDVITPFQFSVHRFAKQFDFSTKGFKTRDWRDLADLSRVPAGAFVCSGASGIFETSKKAGSFKPKRTRNKPQPQ